MELLFIIITRFLSAACPTAVNFTLTTAGFEEGTVITCGSDGYPTPTYSWVDANGVVTAGNTYTLPAGPFNLTCNATGTLPPPTICTVVDTIAGDATTSKYRQTKILF